VNRDDTIVAIATPAGRGGIGVVRIAGARAREIAAPMLRLKHDLEPGRAIFGELIDPCGAGAPSAGSGQAPAREKSDATKAHVWTAGSPEARNPAEDRGVASQGQTRAGAPSAIAQGRSAPQEPAQRIDEVVVTYFAKPHSYTTDDIIEISAHGSPVVQRRIVELCQSPGFSSERLLEVINTPRSG